MSLEIRGLIAAVLAGLIALGTAFGIAAMVRGTQSPTHIQAPLSAPVTVGSQSVLVTLGQGYYAQSCASCHGTQGEGNIGPSLQNTAQSDAQIIQMVTYGMAGEMPAFGHKYDAHDIQAIAAYVHTLK